MRDLLRRASTGAAMALALAFASPASAEPIVLRAITPWQADYDLSKAFFIFSDLVNERMKGKLEIKYLGGPEVAQPNDQFEALRNGIVDISLGVAAYYRAEVPAAAAMQFTKRRPSELRTSGYLELMQKLHEPSGVFYLANASGINGFRMYLTEATLDKPNFAGLQLRVSPVYLPLVSALGGTPVTIAPGEVYTALERGAIDGYGWTYTGIELFGWHEKTKAVIDHPFYALDQAILVNKAVYDGLPEDIKKELTEVAIEAEKKIEAFMSEQLKAEDEKLKGMGLKFIKFSDEDAKKYVETAYEAGWADFREKNKAIFEKDPELEKQLKATGGE
jgi:TRAP-type C4-dicarboxylate transport system substrate-binding protein